MIILNMFHKLYNIFKYNINIYIILLLSLDILYIILSIGFITISYKNQCTIFDKSLIFSLFSICIARSLFLSINSYRFSITEFFSSRYKIILLFIFELLNVQLMIIGTVIVIKCRLEEINIICKIITIAILIFWMKYLLIAISLMVCYCLYKDNQLFSLLQ